MNTHPILPDDSDADLAEAEFRRLVCETLKPASVPEAGRQAGLSRLLSRVGESLAAHAGILVVRAREGAWRRILAGVEAKLLWPGPEGSSVLLRLAPGASLPVHRHATLEEGIVLEGGMQLGDLDLGPGDYHVSPPGSRHGRISSRQGALAYLRGTSLGRTGAMIGELVGGLIPVAGAPHLTVHGRDGDWEPVAPGVEAKALWSGGGTVSRFLRLAPGACLEARLADGDEECMMLQGDAFFGDLLVQAGDFHLAPAGRLHAPVASESGALLFLRGGAR